MTEDAAVLAAAARAVAGVVELEKAILIHVILVPTAMEAARLTASATVGCGGLVKSCDVEKFLLERRRFGHLVTP